MKKIIFIIILMSFGTLLFAKNTKLPGDAKKLVENYERIEQKALIEIRKRFKPIRMRMIEALKQLEKKYARLREYEKAILIRNKVKMLILLEKLPGVKIHDDPGNFSKYNFHSGKKMVFMVTGRTKGGGLWGTDVYTTDSTLALTCVHAGILRPGETNLVRVVFLEGRKSYSGSTRFGIRSLPWAKYHKSYALEPIGKKRDLSEFISGKWEGMIYQDDDGIETELVIKKVKK